MRSTKKHSTQELEAYITLFQQGTSYQDLRKNNGLSIDRTTFANYVRKYEIHGRAGLESPPRNNTYSQEFKDKVAQEYLTTSLSCKQLSAKYNIPSATTVRDWVIKYTKGEEQREATPLPEVYTMKSQTRTQEEKVTIVKDYLDSGMSYKDTAEKYGVSYNNVYSWVRKYKEHGPDGLIDGRGSRKPEQIQTEEEKLRAENVALKARAEYLETENAALKKLREVERELMLRE